MYLRAKVVFTIWTNLCQVRIDDEIDLHMKQIGESERAQQQMNMMNQEYEQPSMSSHNYDVRNFLPVNLLQPEHDRHYSCQDQTPLQLV